jgi:hypothetical protein
MRTRRGKQSIQEMSKANCFIPFDAKGKIKKTRKVHQHRKLLINWNRRILVNERYGREWTGRKIIRISRRI